MDYCKTCIYYPPSSCDGKPCTQCDPKILFHNCYVNKEDYATKERMDERLSMMHKLYPDAKPTNADRIRAMTDEELVFFFWGSVDGSGKTVEQWREWLKQEYTP